MKKYVINMNLIGDPMNYSFVGYEGLKKSDLTNAFEEKMKNRSLFLGKGNTLVDKDNIIKGNFEFDSILV